MLYDIMTTENTEVIQQVHQDLL